jgi:hypothetical protein
VNPQSIKYLSIPSLRLFGFNGLDLLPGWVTVVLISCCVEGIPLGALLDDVGGELMGGLLGTDDLMEEADTLFGVNLCNEAYWSMPSKVPAAIYDSSSVEVDWSAMMGLRKLREDTCSSPHEEVDLIFSLECIGVRIALPLTIYPLLGFPGNLWVG